MKVFQVLDRASACVLVLAALSALPSSVRSNSCWPSQCGENVESLVKNEQPASDFRSKRDVVECTANQECRSTDFCAGSQCVAACPGRCASNALCAPVNHLGLCTCPVGTTGDPFIECRPIEVDDSVESN